MNASHKYWTGEANLDEVEEGGEYVVPNGEDRGPIVADDLRVFMEMAFEGRYRPCIWESIAGSGGRGIAPEVYMVSTPSATIAHRKELVGQSGDVVLIDDADITRGAYLSDFVSGIMPEMIVIDEAHLDMPDAAVWPQYAGRGTLRGTGETTLAKWLGDYGLEAERMLKAHDNTMPLKWREEQHKARLKDHAVSPRKGGRLNRNRFIKGGRR